MDVRIKSSGVRSSVGGFSLVRFAAPLPASPVKGEEKSVGRFGAPITTTASPPRGGGRRGAADADYNEAMRGICREIVAEGDYGSVEPAPVADGLDAMLNGMWLSLLLDPKGFDRAANKRICRAFLASSFPDHFSRDRRDAA